MDFGAIIRYLGYIFDIQLALIDDFTKLIWPGLKEEE